ncbi:hypothetical protein AB0F30_36960, partial [Streptomyces sp. NPDC029006]|uniref:hypothetical protein n=1 Tax=Streptomyces sp. NPDC029006 TaxID=3155467 RepID=UPI0033ED7A2E
MPALTGVPFSAQTASAATLPSTNTAHHCVHHTTGLCSWTHHQKPKDKYETAKCGSSSPVPDGGAFGLQLTSPVQTTRCAVSSHGFAGTVRGHAHSSTSDRQPRKVSDMAASEKARAKAE